MVIMNEPTPLESNFSQTVQARNKNMYRRPGIFFVLSIGSTLPPPPLNIGSVSLPATQREERLWAWEGR
jgi:hypothetical protein